jgi:hypothetical protein
VAKVRINGETFEFDRARKPLAEMMALEKAVGIPYGQWEADLQAGSARALAGVVWLVWRREGRDVAFAGIENGEIEVDFNEFGVEEDEPGDGVDPTAGTPGLSTASTSSSPGPAAGSSRSPASESARGKSGS